MSGNKQPIADQQTDIVIVGGGMAGAFLAAALIDSGLTIHLLDGAPVPSMPTAEAQLRVVALTAASQTMLTNVGVWKLLDQSRLCAYQRMQVWDSDGTGQVDFSADMAAAPALGWMVENQHLVAALYQRLAACPSVHWHSNSRVASVTPEEHGWQVLLASGETLTTRLLVGADGARSLVREAAAISHGSRDTGHRALVTRLHTELAHGNCARQWFMTSGPLAFLPLFGDGHHVSIVWSSVASKAQQLLSLSSAEFSQQLTLASEAALGQVEALTPPVSFPIQELHASRYSAPHLALIGDAAHVVHPLAGQGINLGLLDAAVLAEELNRAQQQGRPYWEAAVLARYQRRRRGHNLMMQQSMRGFQALYAQGHPAIRWLRNSGMSAVNAMTPLKRLIIGEALGRHGDLPQIALHKSTSYGKTTNIFD